MIRSRKIPEGLSQTAGPSSPVRFGPFELDLRSGELRKHGIKIRLHQQPCRILLMLLSHPGEVVLREEIRQALWADDTVVEFDSGINAAIQRLRVALGDSAENPQYIETLPRRGYRFLGTVETPPSTSVDSATTAPEHPAAIAPAPRNWARWTAAAVSVVALLAIGLWASRHFRTLELPQFERLTFRPGIIQGARFAPAGKSVIYAASWDGAPVNLYSLQLGSPESRPLGFPSTGLLAVAATGQMAVSTNVSLQWMRSRGTLAELPATGGAPHELLDNVEFADWTRDGKQMAVTVAGPVSSRLEFPRGHVVFRRPAPDGPATPKYRPPERSSPSPAITIAATTVPIAVVDMQGPEENADPRFMTRCKDWLGRRTARRSQVTASEGGASAVDCSR